MRKSYKMYKIELTTADDRETLIKEYYAETWAETYDKIEELKKMDLNAWVRVYDDKMNHLGNFSKIEKIHDTIETPKRQINTRPIKKLLITILIIAFFPVLILLELIKKC